MRKQFLLIVCSFVLCFLIQCITYNIHITTIPKKTLSLYINKELKGSTGTTGDTVISGGKLSPFKRAFFEAKSDSFYGFMKIYPRDDLTKTKNITLVNIKHNGFDRTYNISVIGDTTPKQAPAEAEVQQDSGNAPIAFYPPKDTAISAVRAKRDSFCIAGRRFADRGSHEISGVG